MTCSGRGKGPPPLGVRTCKTMTTRQHTAFRIGFRHHSASVPPRVIQIVTIGYSFCSKCSNCYVPTLDKNAVEFCSVHWESPYSLFPPHISRYTYPNYRYLTSGQCTTSLKSVRESPIDPHLLRGVFPNSDTSLLELATPRGPCNLRGKST